MNLIITFTKTRYLLYVEDDWWAIQASTPGSPASAGRLRDNFLSRAMHVLRWATESVGQVSDISPKVMFLLLIPSFVYILDEVAMFVSLKLLVDKSFRAISVEVISLSHEFGLIGFSLLPQALETNMVPKIFNWVKGGRPDRHQYARIR